MNVEEIKILKSLAEPTTCTSSHLKIAVPRHLFDEKKHDHLFQTNGNTYDTLFFFYSPPSAKTWRFGGRDHFPLASPGS